MEASLLALACDCELDFDRTASQARRCKKHLSVQLIHGTLLACDAGAIGAMGWAGVSYR